MGNRDGDTFVIKPGREYELLATNHLDGGIYATPAAVGRAIFLRTENALYRIEKPAAATAEPSTTGTNATVEPAEPAHVARQRDVLRSVQGQSSCGVLRLY